MSRTCESLSQADHDGLPSHDGPLEETVFFRYLKKPMALGLVCRSSPSESPPIGARHVAGPCRTRIGLAALTPVVQLRASFSCSMVQPSGSCSQNERGVERSKRGRPAAHTTKTNSETCTLICTAGFQARARAARARALQVLHLLHHLLYIYRSSPNRRRCKVLCLRPPTTTAAAAAPGRFALRSSAGNKGTPTPLRLLVLQTRLPAQALA